MLDKIEEESVNSSLSLSLICINQLVPCHKATNGTNVITTSVEMSDEFFEISLYMMKLNIGGSACSFAGMFSIFD